VGGECAVEVITDERRGRNLIKTTAFWVKCYRRAQRWRARHPWEPLYVIFTALFLIGSCFLVCSVVLGKPILGGGDDVALFIGLVTGGVIWWQGHLIKRQIELSTIIDLYREWNSEGMLQSRRAAWVNAPRLNGEPNPDRIEEVLEFLEKVSTLEEGRFISRVLVWDTFGWYVSRYYFYSKDLILRLRRKWTDAEPDPTLYQDLERFYEKLTRMDLRERNCKGDMGKKLTSTDIEAELERTKLKFIISEKQALDG
jgi:hypothetical protein